MEVSKLLELLSELKTMETGMKSAMKLVDAVEKAMVMPLKEPKITHPIEEQAERCERVWKQLNGFLSGERIRRLQHWAEKVLHWRYYQPQQKYPTPVEKAITDKLRDFTNDQMSELEEILK